MTLPLILLAVVLAVWPHGAGAAAAAIDFNVEQLRAERDRLRAQMFNQQAEIARLRAAAQAASAPAAKAPDAVSVAPDSALDRIAQLQAAIRKGEAASSDLRKEIAGLEAETKRLTAEKQQLLNVQTALTSGLIGALITAAVAIVGALSNFRRSRVDRDFRRLEVIEKAQLLVGKGLLVPADLITRYLGGVNPSGSSAQPVASPTEPNDRAP